MKRGGSSGNICCSVNVTASANSFWSIASRTLKMKVPPGRKTRLASEKWRSLWLVREEHGAELADDHIKCLVSERKLHGVGLAPLDRAARADGGGSVNHGLIEISRDDSNFRRQSICEVPCHDTGSCCYLQQA